MTTEKAQKSAFLFVCEKCQYTTSKKSDYNRHILTPKHKNTTFIQHYTTKSAKINSIVSFFLVNVENHIHIGVHYIITRKNVIFIMKKAQKSAQMKLRAKARVKRLH